MQQTIKIFLVLLLLVAGCKLQSTKKQGEAPAQKAPSQPLEGFGTFQFNRIIYVQGEKSLALSGKIDAVLDDMWKIFADAKVKRNGEPVERTYTPPQKPRSRSTDSNISDSTVSTNSSASASTSELPSSISDRSGSPFAYIDELGPGESPQLAYDEKALILGPIKSFEDASIVAIPEAKTSAFLVSESKLTHEAREAELRALSEAREPAALYEKFGKQPDGMIHQPELASRWKNPDADFQLAQSLVLDLGRQRFHPDIPNGTEIPLAPPYLGFKATKVKDLGAGAFGHVAQIDIVGRGEVRSFAIKTVKIEPGRSIEDAIENAKVYQELENLAFFNGHPNHLKYYGAYRVGNEMHIVMNLMKGDLNNGVARSQMLAIAKDSANGVGAMHEKGLVHLDIKEPNMFLDSNGHAVIGDVAGADTQLLGISIPSSLIYKHPNLIKLAEDAEEDFSRVFSSLRNMVEKKEALILARESDIHALGLSWFLMSRGGFEKFKSTNSEFSNLLGRSTSVAKAKIVTEDTVRTIVFKEIRASEYDPLDQLIVDMMSNNPPSIFSVQARLKKMGGQK